MILETTITVGSNELPATVDFDYSPPYKAPIPRGEYFALEPDENASVTINSITFSDGTEFRSGILFDAMCDEWLEEKCFEAVGE